MAQPLALLAPNADGLVDLYVTASDDVSGMAAMQISASGVFSDTAWGPYSTLKPWTPEGGDGEKTVYARFRDAAGNVSTAANTRFALDTIPPIGGLALAQRVAGPDTMSLLVYLGAEDNLSGVSDMRIGRDPAFGDAPWQPYTTTLAWPASPLAGGIDGGALAGAAAGDAITLYVQYRNEAGNISGTYSDSYTVDTAPPVVYVEVGAGETLARPVNIFAYDELSSLATLRLSNDPLLIEDVVTQPFTPTVTWTFDNGADYPSPNATSARHVGCQPSRFMVCYGRPVRRSRHALRSLQCAARTQAAHRHPGVRDVAHVMWLI